MITSNPRSSSSMTKRAEPLLVLVFFLSCCALPPAQAATYPPPDNALGPHLGAVLQHYAKRHPTCSGRPLSRLPVDLADTIWSQPSQAVPPEDPVNYHDLPRECLVNPTIAWLQDDVFVIVAKILMRGTLTHDGSGWVKVLPLPAENPKIARAGRCSAFSFTGSWHNQLWHNNPDFLVVALIRLDLQTGAPLELLTRRVYKETWKFPAGFVFDARLFRSENGSLHIQQFMTNVPTNAKHMRTIKVITRIDESQPQPQPQSSSPSRRYFIDLAPYRTYTYKNTKFEDKNWVPWHGSTKMSYTNYPTFQPHTVLDFGGWDGPGRNVTAPSSSAPIPLITSLSRFFEAEGLSFRGGTPALPFPAADGASPELLAVGHAVANAQCFHHFSAEDADVYGGSAADAASPPPRGRGRGAPYCPTNYIAQAVTAGHSRAGKPLFRSPLSAYVPMHHFEDYFMFFYTFSARAPYVVTRISNAVIPLHTGQYHAGVYFPAGLDALGPTMAAAPADGGPVGAATGVADKYVLSYGVNDDTGMLLMLTRREIEELLRPVGDVTPESYEFCSLYDRKMSS